jgi:U3 small nucleolar ribonucleoprotein component
MDVERGLEREQRERAIEEIEERLVSGSKWYEKGEVTAEGRPKNSLLTAREAEGPRKKLTRKRDEESEEEESLEFVRNKMVFEWTEEHVREMEKKIRERVKEKRYDNLKTVKRKKVPAKEKSEKGEAKSEERKALHDGFEGKISRNDGFMEKSEIIRLFNEIDAELCALSDHTYVSTEMVQAASTKPAKSRAVEVGTCTREFYEQ